MEQQIEFHSSPSPETVNASFCAVFDSLGRVLIVESVKGGGPELPRNGNGELELPGGGRDEEEGIYDTAWRETLEETGLDISEAAGQKTIVTCLARSAEQALHTGLVIVQYPNLIPVDQGYQSQETKALHIIDPADLMAMPTVQESPSSDRITYRAHRVMAAYALGITSGAIGRGDLIERLFAPFNNSFVQDRLGQHYAQTGASQMVVQK